MQISEIKPNDEIDLVKIDNAHENICLITVLNIRYIRVLPNGI